MTSAYFNFPMQNAISISWQQSYFLNHVKMYFQMLQKYFHLLPKFCITSGASHHIWYPCVISFSNIAHVGSLVHFLSHCNALWSGWWWGCCEAAKVIRKVPLAKVGNLWTTQDTTTPIMTTRCIYQPYHCGELGFTELFCPYFPNQKMLTTLVDLRWLIVTLWCWK